VKSRLNAAKAGSCYADRYTEGQKERNPTNFLQDEQPYDRTAPADRTSPGADGSESQRNLRRKTANVKAYNAFQTSEPAWPEPCRTGKPAAGTRRSTAPEPPLAHSEQAMGHLAATDSLREPPCSQISFPSARRARPDGRAGERWILPTLSQPMICLTMSNLYGCPGYRTILAECCSSRRRRSTVRVGTPKSSSITP